jgi:phage-related baseplate assembly protein
MPDYVSPSLTIDFSRLAPPAVVETVDYEDILQNLRNNLLSKNADLLAAIKLEQSPTNIILEVQSYAEMLVRERVNAAAKAVMLPFSTGTDLDNLAALYNVSRLTIAADPNVSGSTAILENDSAFRSRIQLAPEAYTTAGSGGAYIFQAKTADITIRDASAVQIAPGRVRVCLMNNGSDPTATASQIANASARLLRPEIKPLTDDVIITSVKVVPTTIEATITLFPGPDASVVMAAIQTALLSVKNRVSFIGRELTRAALFAALTQEGVQNVDLRVPAKDIVVGDDACVRITGLKLDTAVARQI